MMQLLRATALAAAAAATVLAVGACGSSRTVHEQHSFRFAGTRLVVDVDSSDLRLVLGTGPGVDVQRWLSGTAAKPGHASWTLHGGTLRLGIDCTGLVFHCGSAFQVAVPPGVAVAVHSGSGTDTVSGLPGPVTITSGSGDVHVNGLSGPLRVSAGSGSITGSGLRCPAVYATSGQGGMDLAFAAAPRLIGIRSGTGSATARVPVAGHSYHVRVSSGTGTASSKVPDDPANSSVIRVSSGSGNASVLPAS
jgi:hypothetical protein